MFKMKKLLSTVLAMAMTVSLVIPSYAINASENYNLVVVEDNVNVRIVETSDENYAYRTTLNKIKNTIDHEMISLTTRSVKKADTVELDGLIMLNDELTVDTRAHQLQENTFINYEYTKTYGSTNRWQIRRPKLNYLTWYYYDVEETSRNISYLNTFKRHVDDINYEEGAVIASIGMAGLSYIVVGASTWGALLTGGVLSPAQWGSILAAAGFSATAATAVAIYDRSCSEAYGAYMDILYLW